VAIVYSNAFDTATNTSSDSLPPQRPIYRRTQSDIVSHSNNPSSVNSFSNIYSSLVTGKSNSILSTRSSATSNVSSLRSSTHSKESSESYYGLDLTEFNVNHIRDSCRLQNNVVHILIGNIGDGRAVLSDTGVSLLFSISLHILIVASESDTTYY
jgi:hypothetical protein